MFTIHTVAGPVRSPADLAGADGALKELLFHHLVDRGIFLAARGFVAMSLAITDDDCDRFVAGARRFGDGDRGRRLTARSGAHVADELVAELQLGGPAHVRAHLARLMVRECSTTCSPSPSRSEHSRHAAATGSSEWNAPSPRPRR